MKKKHSSEESWSSPTGCSKAKAHVLEDQTKDVVESNIRYEMSNRGVSILEEKKAEEK